MLYPLIQPIGYVKPKWYPTRDILHICDPFTLFIIIIIIVSFQITYMYLNKLLFRLYQFKWLMNSETYLDNPWNIDKKDDIVDDLMIFPLQNSLK